MRTVMTLYCAVHIASKVNKLRHWRTAIYYINIKKENQEFFVNYSSIKEEMRKTKIVKKRKKHLG
jgi:hypothetical protein